MKKFLTCALALLTTFALAATAYADIMWEPRSNQFYERHRDACEYENRSYYANGKEGFITVWDAPNGGVVQAQYENGEALYVGYTYDNWALVNRWEDGDEVSGWVPMTDLYLIYDHISFEEEYGDQFRDYNGEFADYDGEAGEEFQFWEYPYAGEPKTTIEMSEDMLDALRGTAGQSSYISKIYLDERNNQTWGYVSYLYGIRGVWLLLDNPTCDGIMASCVPETDGLISAGALTAPQTPVPPAMTAQSWLPYLLVALVVGATAGILVYFYGKRKKSTD